MKRLAFAALAACAIGSGVMTAVVPEEKVLARTELTMTLCYGVLLAVWCLFDGRIRGRQPSSAGLQGILLVFVVGFPIYCIWSRGIRGTLYCLGFVGVLCLFAIAGMGIAVSFGVQLPS